MKRLWMVFLLLSSASTFATEKADFKLKWQEEPKREVLPKNKNDLQGYINENKMRQPNMFGSVDRANRLRFSDPNFASSNSDSGYSNRIRNRH